MSINLGQEPVILILLTLLEILFIIIPALIAKYVDKATFKEEILEMGFKRSQERFNRQLLKIFSGVLLAFGFLLIADYLMIFFRNIIVENLFGTEFLESAEQGAINTTPISPNEIEILVIIILYIVIIAPCEEGFFRGFISKRFFKEEQNLLAVLVSSICFTLYHVPPFIVPLTTILTYFGYYFVFGVVLSIFFKMFNYSLIPVVTAHALFNVLLFIL